MFPPGLVLSCTHGASMHLGITSSFFMLDPTSLFDVVVATGVAPSSPTLGLQVREVHPVLPACGISLPIHHDAPGRCIVTPCIPIQEHSSIFSRAGSIRLLKLGAIRARPTALVARPVPESSNAVLGLDRKESGCEDTKRTTRSKSMIACARALPPRLWNARETIPCFIHAIP